MNSEIGHSPVRTRGVQFTKTLSLRLSFIETDGLAVIVYIYPVLEISY